MSDLTTTLHVLMIHLQAANDAKNIPSKYALIFRYVYIHFPHRTCDSTLMFNTTTLLVHYHWHGCPCFPFSLSAFINVYIYLFLSRNKCETASKAVLPFISTYLHHGAVVIHIMHPGAVSINRSYEIFRMLSEVNMGLTNFFVTHEVWKPLFYFYNGYVGVIYIEL